MKAGSQEPIIPVALFAYARPVHLQRVLNALRVNDIPLLYVYCDGPRDGGDSEAVGRVRELVRAIDWCDVRVTERDHNLGLGKSIRAGVAQVLSKHNEVIVFEDDLICVPGTYAYLAAALRRYRLDAKVMSVTGWTHPRVTPPNVGADPYFDGRAECWVWGTWARAWEGMEESALSLMSRCRERRIDVTRYGTDLQGMAAMETSRNLWAVRFLYLHILKGGLCLRPPWSMVEHIGYDHTATNSPDMSLQGPPLRDCPPLPAQWPLPVERRGMSRIWRCEAGRPPSILSRVWSRVWRLIRIKHAERNMTES